MMTLLTLLAPTIALGGCGAQTFVAERQAISQAQFDFERLVLRRADVPLLNPEAGAEFDVVLRVTNPNSVDARLDQLDYDLYLEGQKVGSGAMTNDFAVPAGATDTLILPITLKYQGLPSLAIEAMQKRQANVTLKGVSHLATPFGRLDYPVELNHLATF
jgi:LEA14-like dessication related protein